MSQRPQLLLGGHVRTGLEDHLYYRHGELATPAEAREIIGLPLQHGAIRPEFALG